MLVVLWSPRVRLASLHTASLSPSAFSTSSLSQLSKHSPFIDPRRQRRTNTWSRNKDSVLLDRSRLLLVLPSLVKMRVGRGNIYTPDRNTDYSTTSKIWVTQQVPEYVSVKNLTYQWKAIPLFQVIFECHVW